LAVRAWRLERIHVEWDERATREVCFRLNQPQRYTLRRFADARLLISNSRKSERGRMAVRACCAALGSGSKTRKYSLAPKNASMSNFARPVFQVRDLVGDRKRRMN